MYNTLTLTEKKELLEYLSGFITVNRKKRLQDIVVHRTRYLTVVIENIFQSHNTSAVLRSCECFGIQDVHIIENENLFKTAPDISLGSEKWLNLHHYHSEDATAECLGSLKNKGYTIVATTPHKNSFDLQTLPVEKKFALVFGTELNGISDVVNEYADHYVKIPMVGFTESLNISVSAGISLNVLSDRIRKSQLQWTLSEDEITSILIDWVRKTVKKPEVLEKDFFKSRK